MKWLWLTLLVVAADQLSKIYVSATIAAQGPVSILPGFNLVLACNTGAAFSFLSDASGWQRWFFVVISAVVSIALLVWLLGLKGQKHWLSCALALILGGALGNLWDRASLGCVIDFIQVYLSFIPLDIFNPWPTFNIADSAITGGAIMLIIDTFLFDDVRFSAGKK